MIAATTVNTIRDQQRILLADLAKLEVEHAQLALNLISDPTDLNKLEPLEECAAKVEATKKRLELFEFVIKGAESKDKADAEAARLSAAVAAHDEVLALIKKRNASAAKIDSTMTTLAGHLTDLIELNEELTNKARQVVQNIHNPKDPHYDREMSFVGNAARHNIAGPFVQALISAGAENIIGLGELHQFLPPTLGRGMSVADVAAFSGERLVDRMGLVLRRVQA